ncbi:MAG: DUF3971 domain-containing protein [Gammaproteobacteria bacterium]|nr:DUF3971 domain-containing protein [Gammaproteobacteria bacterium]MCW8986149.1 DUF3971 domain-containing protein [Gammaproteobacteria bacterium]MCW9030940.1 DUF3971 domain-containing protein [Gammaproteobacteria bacterium]
MAKNHSLFHKLKAVLGYGIAVAVIVVALGVSGLRLILSTANIYQYEVEQFASSLFKQPVKIGRMDAKLSGLMPTLIFHNVELISEKTNKSLFSLSRVDVGILFNDLLFQQKVTPAQLTIRGMNLFITRTVEGNLRIKGVDIGSFNKVEADEYSPFFEEWLLQQGEVAIEESTFAWKDEQKAGLTWFFDDVNLLLKKTHERHQLLLSTKLPNVLGDKLKVAIDLVGDIASPSSWDINTYIESKNINLAPLQQYINNKNIEIVDGIADLKLWLDWKKENIKQLSGNVGFNNLSYRLNKNKLVTLKHVSGIFDSYKDERNLWNMSIERFFYESDREVSNNSKFSLAFNYENKLIENFYIRANQLKLDALSKIIIDNNLVSKEHENQIKQLSAKGDIHDFYIAWQNNELQKLNAKFSNLGINAWNTAPGLNAVSGSVAYAEQKGAISLSSINSVVGFPKLFRDDFKFDYLTADIGFVNVKEGLLFDVKQLTTKSSEVSSASKAKFWLPKDGTNSYLDLQTHLSEGDISKISHYLPVTIMDKSLVQWLDKALLEGKLNKGTVVFNGKLGDFPFNNKEGEFAVGIETSDFLFNYKEGWPKITKAKLDGIFTGQGLKLHLKSGEAGNNAISNSYAEIKSFAAAEVQLDLMAMGSTHNVMQYLINSPILPKAKNTINSMKLLGNVEAKMKVNIPLADSVRKKKSLSYSGSAKLHDTSLYMIENKVDITKGSGTILFSEKGLSSNNLIAHVLDKKATFTVSSDKGGDINISANGEMEANIILNRFNIPGAKRVSGSMTFQANMAFPAHSAKDNHPVLTVNSDLMGIKSTLPEYLYKKEQDKQDFEFIAGFVGNDRIQLGVEFGKKGSAILELDQAKKTTYLRKGAISVSNKKAILPRKNVLYIDGVVKKITPNKWIEALELNEGVAKQAFFVNPIIFNLDELKIVTEKEGDKTSKAISIPQNFPAFEGIIKKFYLDKDFIGRLDFKVSQKNYGLHLDELIVSAKNMKLFSHGDWKYIRGLHKTNMNITLSSKNFGGMLTDLGYAVVIDQGTAQATGDIDWQGTPLQFSLAKLNGNLQLKVEKGSIVDVDAGAGRLLGLFSLSALPRKLFGDFKDSAKSGFSFDTASGHLKIDEGDVYTDDFQLDSPIADVSISGRVGLADRDYENTIEVVPDVGGGVAGVTALLVNLPAGIGLWLLDKLTGEQFNEASTKVYEVSGSWDKPVIVLRKAESL